MKRLICFLLVGILAITMLLLPVDSAVVDNDSTGSVVDIAMTGGGVQNRINELKAVYDSGTYFTSDGDPYYQDSGYNCRLSSIPERGNLPSGASVANAINYDPCSCDAFACYAFYHIFGQKRPDTANASLKYVRVGDMLYFSRHHWAIYLGQDDENWYVYDSNGDWVDGLECSSNKVLYFGAHKKNAWGDPGVFRASNYDTIDGDVRPTNAYVIVSNSSILTGQSNTFTFGANNATSYDLKLYKNDALFATNTNVKSTVSYTFTEEGIYHVAVTAKNSKGSVTTSKVQFFVMNALDFGSMFIAKIKNTESGLYVSAGGTYGSSGYPNVYLASETSNNNNIWKFERQDNYSYKVTNVETGYCLDVNGGSANDGTNIGLYPSNDTISQRWYIRNNMDTGYALAPKLILTSDLSIFGNNSLYNNNIFDGANIALVGNNSVKAQRFVFELLQEAPNEWISIEKEEYTSKEKVTFNFGATGATKYTLCVDLFGERVLTEDVKPGCSYSFDKSGDYTAYVICTFGDSSFNVSTKKVSFYNRLIFDFGDRFIANIKNTASNYYLTTGKQAPNMSYPDVYVATKATDGASEWLFEKQADYTYKITNKKTGYVLDLFGGKTDNLTNIDTFPSNDTDAQRWFISNNMDGYAFVPKVNYHRYLSITGNKTIYGECIFDGANVSLYGIDNVKSQRFALENIVDLTPTEPTMPTEAPTDKPTEPPTNTPTELPTTPPTIPSTETPTTPPTEPSTIKLGDVDGDGEVTIIDATCIQRKLASIPTARFIDKAADADGDGSLSIIDATTIQRWLANLPSNDNVGKPIK